MSSEQTTSQIKTIQKCIRKWLENKNKLEPIVYKGDKIKINDINVFTYKNRSKNDSYNKKRENIIVCIINNNIPKEYYRYSLRWYNLNKEIDSFIKKLGKMKGITYIENVDCIHEAGRGNHHDMLIIINNNNNNKFIVEFKYGALRVDDTPQFVSPMKPSQYLTMDFESWYYDNYLFKIAKFSNLEMPVKEEYYKNIHNNKVECMKEFKEKYDKDKNFNKYCKKTDKEAIKQFIQLTEIDKDKLSEYLLKSQRDKHYMCYCNNKIYYDTLNENVFKICKLVKKDNTNYIYQTSLGMKLQIKLRFKNGCGLQFPAFQISRKIPTVKELKKICVNNNIKAPKLKKDILNILNQNSIMY